MIETGGARKVHPPAHPVPVWALALPVLVVIAATATAVGMIGIARPAKTASVAGGVARIGGTAPAFTSWDLSGKSVSLADYNGRPVLLTFWATWCTACQKELPALQKIRDSHRSSGFAVLAVNYKETDSARMSQYLTRLHVNLESIIDPEGAIATAYGVNIGLPIDVLLDRQARVSRIIVGLVPSATLDAAVVNVAGPGS